MLVTSNGLPADLPAEILGPTSALQRARARARRACAASLALLLAAPAVDAGVIVYRRVTDDGQVIYTLERTPDEPSQAESDSRSGAPASPIDIDAREPAPQPVAPSEPEAEEPPSEQADGEDLDIREQIERDREALRELVSRPGTDGTKRREDPELREISERLPRLQNELEAVEGEPAP